MKILVFNGSPKREKSDTMCITRAFLEGMEAAGTQDVKIIHAIDRHVEYCSGCFACMHNGGHCIHDDDMRGILEEILQSNLLIFSYPLYCYGMPAPLKAIIDRILPLSKMTMEKVGDRYEHVGQADQFKLLFPNGHTILTVPESPMFNVPQAAVVTVPRLELVKEAGKQYAETGKIDDELLKAVCSPMIPEEQYAAIVNAGA